MLGTKYRDFAFVEAPWIEKGCFSVGISLVYNLLDCFFGLELI
jgi:hypothetical protein